MLSGTDSRRGSRPQPWLGPPVPVVLIRLQWQGLAVGGMLFGAAAWQLSGLGRPEAKLVDALIIGQTLAVNLTHAMRGPTHAYDTATRRSSPEE